MSTSMAVHWLHSDDEGAQTASSHNEAVHARLARLKVEQVKRQVDELRDRWPTEPNVLERLLLQARFRDEHQREDGE